jgi:hypothetical protein
LADSQALMGYGTTRLLERVLASCGLLVAAALKFVPAADVPQAGVLCALPALLTEGLLRHTHAFYRLPAGYYPLESIFLYLALLALVRCPSLEQTRYQSPGEWGKILGLDRLPEVKTLREKVSLFREQEGCATQWQSRLAQEWMAGAATADPEKQGVGLFYVDGHVRVYHGGLGPLPRLYVAREKLLLRGTTDYWVNGLGGEPFFVVTQPIHAGLIAALAPAGHSAPFGRCSAAFPSPVPRGCASAALHSHLRPGRLFAQVLRRVDRTTDRPADLP